MTPYRLWNPHLVTPTVVRCWITLGDALFLSRGTAELAAAAAAAIGVPGAVAAWTCEAVRTNYFSWYRLQPDADWESRWNLAWRLTVTLDRAVERPLPPLDSSIDLHAVDASFRLEDRPDLWPEIRGVVLADARTHADAEVLARIGAPLPCERGLAFGSYPQLAFDLGVRPAAWFADGAADGERLVDALAAAGASTHRLRTLEWIDEDGR